MTTVVQVAAQTLRYDTLDTTGAVGTAGSYAFLEDPDDPSTAVTTYEGLRDGGQADLDWPTPYAKGPECECEDRS